MSNSRQVTNKLLEMLDEGTVDPRALVFAALNFMSESEVREMAEAEGFIDEEEVAELEEESDTDEDDLFGFSGDDSDEEFEDED